MNQVDSSIPLQVQQPNFINPAQLAQFKNQLYANELNALRVQEAQREVTSRNALTEVFKDPTSVDDQGMPTRNALNKVMAIDPEKGMTLQNNLVRMQEQRELMASRRIQQFLQSMQINETQLGALEKVEVGLQSRYDSLIESGVPKAEAIKVVSEEKKQKREELVKSGFLTKDQLDKISGQFDPEGNKAFLAASPEYKRYLDEQRQLRQEKTREKAEEETPYIKELKQKLKAQGLKEGTPEYNKEYAAGLKKRTAREEAPTTTMINLGPGQSVIPDKDREKHGEDFLKTLPVGIASEVKAIAEYRVPISALGIRGPQREATVQRVTQYDPNWDQTNYQARQGLRKDFTSGKAAQNITAINTALGHIGTMSDLSKAVASKDLQTVNKLLNRLRSETGNPTINNYEIATAAVSNELMRVFRQVGASEVETADWQKRFSAALTPDQKVGAIRTAAELLQSRIDAIDDQWKRGMGTDKGYPNLLSPKAKKVLDEVTGLKDESSYSKSGTKVKKLAPELPADVQQLLDKYK